MLKFYGVNQNKKLAIMLMLFLFFPKSISALDYTNELRTAYSDNIKEICHASVEYDLDMQFENYEGEDGAKTKYNKTMECLFESSFVRATNDMNKDFNEKFFQNKQGMFDFVGDETYKTEDLDKPSDCSEKEIDDIFEAQVENGYKTLCKVDGRKSTVEEVYSSCRVAEVAFNEFCAYQEYLLWKQTDETIRKESDTSSRTAFFQTDWNQRVYEYNKEIDISYTVLLETLEQFHTYAQNYRMHLWEKVIDNALIVTRTKIGLIKDAIDKWPVKFHNAAIQQ